MDERGPARSTSGAEMRASISRRLKKKKQSKEHVDRFGQLAHGVDGWKTLRENAANAIWKQLGRSRFMIGAKSAASSNGGQTLTFRIGRNAKTINWIRITLDHADTYEVEFGRGYKKPRVVDTVKGVYVDQLANVIGGGTGMAVSM